MEGNKGIRLREINVFSVLEKLKKNKKRRLSLLKSILQNPKYFGKLLEFYLETLLLLQD